MKNNLKTAFVYIGLVIGAGFASGREIMEYFNLKSSSNSTGVLCAAFLFMLIAYLIGIKASENNLSTFDEYIDSIAGKASPAVKIFMLLYMFCGLFVMYAGSGALINAVTPFSSISGAVLMAVICFVVLNFDISGIVAVNIILVPLMIFGIILISIYYTVFKDIPTFAGESYITYLNNTTFTSGFLPIVSSAICYASYNTLTAASVLVPLTQKQSLPDIRKSSIFGGFIISFLIIVIWYVQGLSFDIISDDELPMLTLAALCGKHCKYMYTSVLFMSICTTSISYGYGILSHFSKLIKSKKDKLLFTFVICISALPPALYGFSNLVSNMYSLFGYIGIIWILWIIIDQIK